MTLFSLGLLPVLVPLIIASIIWAMAMFGHLHFKHIKMNKICVVTSLVSVPFSLFYYQLIQQLSVYNTIPKMDLHIGLTAVFFGVVSAFCMISAKRTPSILQIAGVVIFAMGCFFTLA
jgi:hypothetical protein